MSDASGQDLADRFEAARKAVQARNSDRALSLLAEFPTEALPTETLMDKALAYRMQGRLDAAIQVLDTVLVRDPYHFLALLSKGALVEKRMGWKAAVPIYKGALKIAPSEPPAGLDAPLKHAREIVQRYGDSLAAHLRAITAPIRDRFPGEDFDRFDESLEVFAGRARPYPHEPLLLHYTRLPAITYFPRHYFPWLPELEAATADIQQELILAQTHQAEGFRPYIDYPPGAPVNQWGELHHNPRWSTFFLWRDGKRFDEACALCPKTTALMERLPIARQPDFAPTVMFSALAPHTRIPPHTGSANTRLIVHLPLVLPGPAWFRVGADTRSWNLGEAWVFDDSIEHEAMNEADETRVILIFDVWNPLLSEAERELITAMMQAKNDFQSL